MSVTRLVLLSGGSIETVYAYCFCSII